MFHKRYCNVLHGTVNFSSIVGGLIRPLSCTVHIRCAIPLSHVLKFLIVRYGHIIDKILAHSSFLHKGHFSISCSNNVGLHKCCCPFIVWKTAKFFLYGISRTWHNWNVMSNAGRWNRNRKVSITAGILSGWIRRSVSLASSCKHLCI